MSPCLWTFRPAVLLACEWMRIGLCIKAVLNAQPLVVKMPSVCLVCSHRPEFKYDCPKNVRNLPRSNTDRHDEAFQVPRIKPHPSNAAGMRMAAKWSRAQFSNELEAACGELARNVVTPSSPARAQSTSTKDAEQRHQMLCPIGRM